MGSPITNLGLSCPKSGSFYICEDQPTRFVGCCTINPCTTHDGLCPGDDVRPASFSPDAYDKIPAQDCLDPGFLWYTCRDSSPPFLGCCSQMGCETGGCPVNKVGAASLSGNAKQAAPFLSARTSTTSSSSSTTSRASSTTLSTAVSTTVSAPAQQSTQPPADPPSTHTGLSKGAIGGISVAAVAGACILVFVAFWALRLRKKRQSSMAVGGSGKGRLDQDREDSLTDSQDGKPAASHTLPGGHSGNTAAGQMALFPPAQISPALKSPVISELPATPSQQSVNSGVTPATRHIASMSSLNGAGGRESAISGITASAQQSPQWKQQSPLIHQSLFELEGSSSRAFVERKQ